MIPAARPAILLGQGDRSNNASIQDLGRTRAAEIREASQYFEHAFPGDELFPVNSTGNSNRVYGRGWSLSMVDTSDIAIIMVLAIC